MPSKELTYLKDEGPFSVYKKRKKESQVNIEDIKETDILLSKNEKFQKEDVEVFSEAIKFSKKHQVL